MQVTWRSKIQATEAHTSCCFRWKVQRWQVHIVEAGCKDRLHASLHVVAEMDIRKGNFVSLEVQVFIARSSLTRGTCCYIGDLLLSPSTSVTAEHPVQANSSSSTIASTSSILWVRKLVRLAREGKKLHLPTAAPVSHTPGRMRVVLASGHTSPGRDARETERISGAIAWCIDEDAAFVPV